MFHIVLFDFIRFCDKFNLFKLEW
jgi:hypothetical protein